MDDALVDGPYGSKAWNRPETLERELFDRRREFRFLVPFLAAGAVTNIKWPINLGN